MDYRYRRPTNFQFGYGSSITPVIKGLVIANILVFLAQQFAQRLMIVYLGLIPQLVINSYAVWQLFTYMFLHGNITHILINMFMLWMFGSEIELTLGSVRFLIYYLLCGVGAGLTTVFFMHDSIVPIIGASGAIYGILLAYGILFPNRTVLFMFIFPMKVKYMVLIFAGIEFFYSASQSQDGISHITHLGGMLFGGIYLMCCMRNYGISWIKTKLRQRSIKRRLKVAKDEQNTYNKDDDKNDDDKNQTIFYH